MPSTRSPCQQHASVRMSRNTAHVACGACGGRAGKWVSGEVAVHLGPPVLDKVERSWSCWRHPNASGVGLKVAGAMETVEPHKAQSDFLLLNVGLTRTRVPRATPEDDRAGVGPRVVELKRRQSGRLPVRRSSGHACWPCAWPDDLGHGWAARRRSSRPHGRARGC